MASLIKHTSYPIGAVNAGCVLCGNPWQRTQKYCVVTDIRIPRYGQICLCDTCVGALSKFTEVKASPRAAELQTLTTEVEKLSEILARIASLALAGIAEPLGE